MKRKILSISGVITNSSTEIYTYYCKNNISDLKNVGQLLLNSIPSLRNEKFDDLFTVDFEFDTDSLEENEIVEEYYSNKKGFVKKKKLDSLLKDPDFITYVLDRDSEYDSYTIYCIGLRVGLTEKGNSLGLKNLAEFLSNHTDVGERKAVYC